MLDRRSFLKGLVATAAGVLIPGVVAAEPERRIWALDRTMVRKPLVVRVAENPYNWTYDIVFKWADGFTQTVTMTRQQLLSGATIPPVARNGVVTGWEIAMRPDSGDGVIDLWPSSYAV